MRCFADAPGYTTYNHRMSDYGYTLFRVWWLILLLYLADQHRHFSRTADRSPLLTLTSPACH